ncbi:DEAD/DEAH box RNA helicase [Achlya hypogyna]|uniref:DEAD/DEAH box RNA helicase n=1 Tax=Achlya hypogyna TaxID=1202772 RepID=A0A1V9Z0Z3_ACHHY|nr:DEAD/DEAH box RNA helicase [Achlya hypogyna]
MLSRQVSSLLALAVRRHSRPLARTSLQRVAAMRFHSSIPSMAMATDETPRDLFEAEEIADVDAPSSGFVNQKPIADFDLSPRLVMNLEDAGITHLFPVQVESFQIMLDGKDIMGRSKTGSGKTLAFALPIAEKLLAEGTASRRMKNPRAIVMLPTRELAQQVEQEFRRIAPQLRTCLVVGGVSYTTQEAQLHRGIDVLVGTPGRVVDMMNKGALDLSEIQVGVLDEADMMLKFGFQEEVETILGAMPEDKQCVMWSATVPKWVLSLSRKYLNDPVSIDLVGDDDSKLPSTVSHKAIVVTRDTKDHVLESVLHLYANGGQALIFTETKQEADELVAFLSTKTKGARVLHGDLSQNLRTATMKGFRNGDIRTLICTDIAARGLDIAAVDLVIQYRLSNDKEAFVHRAGRTGRAGRSGINVVLFEPRDLRDLQDLQKAFGVDFNHVAPPKPEQMLAHAMTTVQSKMDGVHPESRAAFDAAARSLFTNEEEGVEALSAALALIAGFESRGPTVYSMLSGTPHYQTVQLVADRTWNADTISRWLADSKVNVSFNKILRGANNTYYLDIPAKQVAKVLARADEEGVALSVVEELEKITMPQTMNRGSDRFGGASRFGGNNRGGYGGRQTNDRYRGSSPARGGDRNNGRAPYAPRFDSGFSNDRSGSFDRRGGNDRSYDRSRSNERGNRSSSWSFDKTNKWL